MPTIQVPPHAIRSVPVHGVPRQRGEVREFLRRALAFVAIGLLLYGALYAASERLVRERAHRNRFHVVQAAPHAEYDYVILGASHAAVFDYRDMNRRLEEMTGAKILNLATVGAGVTVNRLLLDYFFTRRTTAAVIYVLDSFAFYSPEWNEQRLKDTRLYSRAPWDPALARLLLRQPAARSAALGYISGFPKINDHDRFEPDLFPGEGSSFDRVYRPIPQLDRQRLEYLYPDEATEATLLGSPYLAELEALIDSVHIRGARFLIVRPPIPERIHAMIPNEDHFGRTLGELAQRKGVELYDFSRVSNDPRFFYDSDHLNQAGVLNFFTNHLRQVLVGR